MAAGSRQSPVNIETDRAESDHESLSTKPLRWKYPAYASRKLVNPGYCWRIDCDGDGTCESNYSFPLKYQQINHNYILFLRLINTLIVIEIINEILFIR